MQNLSLRGLRTAAAAVLAAGALAACSDDVQTPLAAVPGPLMLVDTAGTVDAVAYNDTLQGTYRVGGANGCSQSVTGSVLLRGIVSFEAGCTLTVAAGTEVYAEVNPSATAALVINQGAYIVAVGTSSNPVVFTSSRARGTRVAGDWGGIVIVGKSTCNGQSVSPQDCDIEGLNGLPIDTLTFGGNPVVQTDSSGALKYVRIEFAGRVPVDGDELNALTLYSVGSGTDIEFVQVHRGTDDGFELFGGTVNLKNLLASAISDDSFDYSYGWTGALQFFIAQQLTGDGDKGIEADNDEGTFNYTPRTNPRVYNGTLIGRASALSDTTGLTDGNDGVHLRRGVAGDLANLIVMGWKGSAIDVDDNRTFDFCPQVSNSIFWTYTSANYWDPDLDGPTAGTGADREKNCLTLAGIKLPAREVGGSATNNPNLVAPFNRTLPDFRFNNLSSAAKSGAKSAPVGDPFLTSPGYIGGAAGNNVTPWYDVWASFADN